MVEFSSISEHMYLISKVLLSLCQHKESESISHTLREGSCNTAERLVLEIYKEVLTDY